MKNKLLFLSWQHSPTGDCSKDLGEKETNFSMFTRLQLRDQDRGDLLLFNRVLINQLCDFRFDVRRTWVNCSAVTFC